MALATRERSTRSVPTAAQPPPARRTRALAARVSLGHVVMVVAGLLAFVFVAGALRDRSTTVPVLVAARDLPAGALLDAASTRVEELPANSPVAAQLLDPARLDDALVTAAPVRRGEPILAGQTAAAAPSSGLRAMSVPVAEANAVGGALGVGDRVDIADVDRDGNPVWVVTGAQVTAVGDDTGGGLASPDSSFYLVVEVDADGALRLAAALADGKVNVVRSTGAPPIEATATTVAVGS